MKTKNISRRSFMLAAALSVIPANRAHAGRITRIFNTYARKETVSFDHSAFDELLQRYVVVSDDGVNRVKYDDFKRKSHGALRAYLKALEAVSVHQMTHAEQFAFWINLYNAKTLDVVLDAYPVASIKDINLGGGLFAKGPWKKKLVRVEGQKLSLDNIEHDILRPIWRDARIHYAVNCASVGCPNLHRRAYVAGKLERQLTKAAQDFINHPRGVDIQTGGITASKIYDWYAADFGGRPGLPAHWRRYGKAPLIKALRKPISIKRYVYDWRLNSV